MAFTNKVLAVVAVVFVALAIGPRLGESQSSSSMFPDMTTECATVMPDILDKCFGTVRETPTEECCNDLKTATSTQVNCLCLNYIANPKVANITGPYADGITTKCGAFDKFSCDDTTTKGGDENKEDGSSSKSTEESNGGKPNKVAASMAVFALLASFFFVMF